MAKIIPDAILDSQLDIIGAATILVICAGQPTSYADATATKDLATHVLAGGNFSKGNGDTSGRKLTLAAQNGITVDHDGLADHYFLGISGSSTFLLVGTLNPTQQTYAGNIINFPATDVDEARDLA
jgi:hypothetical protein